MPGATPKSRPLRARGLKQVQGKNELGNEGVAPFTGAWIETYPRLSATMIKNVAPFTGAWIETSSTRHASPSTRVAPFTGAWIETQRKPRNKKKCFRRALYGRVD